MQGDWVKRLGDRLGALGRNPYQAAAIGGLSRSFVRDLIAGEKKSVSVDALPALAKAADWTVVELLDISPVERVPIRGIVEAGAWREPWDTDFPADFPVGSIALSSPRFPEEYQFSMIVRGNSMDATKPFPILDGCSVQCVSWIESGLPIEGGLIVVVERTSLNGKLVERSLKRVVDIGGALELRSESTTSRHPSIPIEGGGKLVGDGIKIVAIVIGVTGLVLHR